MENIFIKSRIDEAVKEANECGKWTQNNRIVTDREKNIDKIKAVGKEVEQNSDFRAGN